MLGNLYVTCARKLQQLHEKTIDGTMEYCKNWLWELAKEPGDARLTRHMACSSYQISHPDAA